MKETTAIFLNSGKQKKWVVSEATINFARVVPGKVLKRFKSQAEAYYCAQGLSR